MPTSPVYAPIQPRDGETICSCAHFARPDGRGRKFIWTCFDQPNEFTRPDGTTGESRWIAICQQCFMEYGKAEDAIEDDWIWKGDEPIIKPFGTQ